MKVKGTGVVSTMNFIKEKFGEEACAAWLSSLPEDTQHVLRYALSSSWYDMLEMQLKPGRRLCEMFYPGDLETGARHWGASAANRELTGIYKVLLKMGSPNMMIAVCGTTWKTFYSEGTLVPIVNQKGYAEMQTRNADIPEPLWGFHSAGWFEGALALAGGKNGMVEVTRKRNGLVYDFHFTLSWEY